MGSPETETSRGLYTENLTAVTILRPFEIGQTEVTREQWLAHVSVDPTKDGPDMASCYEPDCPVLFVSWFDALAFANLLSSAHDPPLAECFTLEGCTGEVGSGLKCGGVRINAPSLFECEGYRLPSEAEWEYAARAGTRTAHYGGELLQSDPTIPDRGVGTIAWYNLNSDRTAHPVARKAPNRFGLTDMLGNADEWVFDAPRRDPPGPLTDPVYSVDNAGYRVLRGGRASMGPHSMRSADRVYLPEPLEGQGLGFRLARTLFE